MEKSHLIETEPVTGNIDEFYEFVSGESRLAANAPGHTAWEMESLTALLGWPVGEVIGREAELREQFGVEQCAMFDTVAAVDAVTRTQRIQRQLGARIFNACQRDGIHHAVHRNGGASAILQFMV